MKTIVESLSNFFQGVNIWISILVTIFGLALLLVLLIVASRKKWNASVIAEVGIAAALSMILSLFPVWRMPQGGSITLSMLPVLVIAFRRGFAPGLIAGLIAGMLQSVVDPFIVSVPQFLLDYGLSYTVLGLAGLGSGDSKNQLPVYFVWGFDGLLLVFSTWAYIWSRNYVASGDNPGPSPWIFLILLITAVLMIISLFAFGKKVSSLIALATLGIFARTLMHFLSGMVYFSQYAWQGYNSALYSLSYNLLYIIPSAILCFVVLVPLIKTGVVARVE